MENICNTLWEIYLGYYAFKFHRNRPSFIEDMFNKLAYFFLGHGVLIYTLATCRKCPTLTITTKMKDQDMISYFTEMQPPAVEMI